MGIPIPDHPCIVFFDAYLDPENHPDVGTYQDRPVWVSDLNGLPICLDLQYTQVDGPSVAGHQVAR